MAVEEAPRLLPTLQTVLGMVRHNGLPCRRALPDGKTSVADANEAAIRDPSVTLYELKRYMRSRRRLDLEQAVAMVLSLLPDEDTRVKLARLVGPDMLRGSCMWRVAPEDYQTPTAPFEAALESYKGKVQRIMSKYTPADASSTDDRELALLMLRVRRHRPGLGNSQRLRLPQMLLQHLPDLDARDRHIWSLVSPYLPKSVYDSRAASKRYIHTGRCAPASAR